ncbi:MAG: DUF4249 family protein [Bacteroidales bacterium]|nr:DUF4249 family protein [Bacteroidales bacterium]
MRKKTKSILLIFAIILLGCKEEFLLETTNYKPIMVVDGMITNEPGPYTIKISFSSPLPREEGKTQVEGCTVTIYENSNKSEVLSENEPGIYVSSEGGIQGVIGNNYSISILTPDNKEYESDLQEMKEPIEIESIYTKVIKVNKEEYPEGLPGYQFYLDTETSPSQDNYFLWKATETFEYTVDYKLMDIRFYKPELDTNLLLRMPIVQEYKSDYFTCWKSQNINYVFTGKTTNLNIPKIIGQPILFVGTDTKKLKKRYSLNLKQYTVNKDTYYYWKRIEEYTTDENILISKQPYNIIGNIKNKNNPNEMIFGNFTAASVAQKRIFVDKPKEEFHYNICELYTDPGTIQSLFENANPPFYLIEYGNSFGFGVLTSESCIKCTLSGGNNFKPDFWIDK